MMVKLGRYADATAMLEEVVKANPDYVPALILLGDLYNSQKNVDKAIAIYEKVIKISPDNKDAALFLGVLYLSKGETQKA